MIVHFPVRADSVVPDNFKKAFLLMESIDNQLRQEILKMLNENTQLSVSEITKRLVLTQSLTSGHLANLRNAGLVSSKRIGRNVCYQLNKEKLIRIFRFVENILGYR